MDAIELDPISRALFINVPVSKVALLQSLFETYEGIGTVRTLDIKNNLVAILTTRDCLEECTAVLKAEKELLHWQPVNAVTDEMIEKFYWSAESA